MTKRFLAVFTAILISMTTAGCSSGSARNDIISGSGDIEFSQGSDSSAITPEFPDPSSKPESLSGESSSSSSASSSSSSSKLQASSTSQSSSKAQSSSKPQSSSKAQSSSTSQSKPAPAPAPSSSEVRSVWVSYLELDTMLKGKSQSQFTSNIKSAFDKIKNIGLNTVFVQVRPFGDALYDSSVFPWSYICTGTEGNDPGFDPLKIMVKEAHSRGLQIEAWINPYRIRTSGSKAAICNSNPAKKFIANGSDAVIEYKGGTYYNPGSQEARDLITDGVVEIINYGVDGIHFDDYFYPTTDMSFDADTYSASGSTLSQANWRRENVNKLVRQVYSAIKSADSSVRFGISPQGNMDNNYDGQFIDVAKWVSGSGYVDYICPQIYYGFKNSSQPYAQTVKSWNNLIKSSSVDLYVGLAAYKIGQTDTYAGAGKEEWLNSGDILARMVEEGRNYSNFKGFCLYRYDSLLTDKTQEEIESLKNVL